LEVRPVSPASDFTFEVVDGVGIITAYTGPGGAVVIPSNIGGVVVRAIDSGTNGATAVFKGNTTITSVVIPDTVTTIERETFRDASNLAELTLPSGLTTITSHLVRGTALTTFNIPTSVTRIESNSIRNMPNLTNLTLHEGITFIDMGAFMNNPQLILTTLPSTVTEIGGPWFFEGTRVTRSFYEAVIAINPNVDEPLEIIEDGGVSDADFIFDAETGTITAYNGAGGAVVIPGSIGGVAVTAIGAYAFSGRDHASNPNSPLHNPAGNNLAGTLAITSVEIPDSVTAIGGNAFRMATGMTSVKLSASLTEIGDSVFQDSGLTGVTLPEGLVTVGRWSFQNTKLTEVTIPASVKNLLEYAFGNNVELREVFFLGDSFDEFHNNAFRGGSSAPMALTAATAARIAAFNPTACPACTHPACSIIEAGADADFAFDAATGTITAYNGAGGAVVIPGSIGGVTVTAIGAYAFSGREHASNPNSPANLEGTRAITSVEIPDSVTAIGGNAFRLASNMTSIQLSAGLTEIGDSAFQDSGLTGVTLPDGLITIGQWSFQNTMIAEVTIPASVKNLLQWAFGNNSELTEVNFLGTDFDELHNEAFRRSALSDASKERILALNPEARFD
jgi:hypothetical protein